jgi:hypothetical protein
VGNSKLPGLYLAEMLLAELRSRKAHAYSAAIVWQGCSDLRFELVAGEEGQRAHFVECEARVPCSSRPCCLGT